MSHQYAPIKDRYVMYGAEFSLYSGKLRTYLRKKGIPFEERLSDLKAYKKFIIPRTGVRYIPVLQTPTDEVLQDTSEIIDHLEIKFPNNPVLPNSPKQRLAALLLETFGDEWLLIPAMHYRWNYPEVNQPFIYREFGRTLIPAWPRFIQGLLGKKIGNKFRGFLPMLGITEKSTPAIEASYMQLLTDLDRHFKHFDFLLGERPSIGDFGMIAPLYAHLYRDPYPGEFMRKMAPNVSNWVERMISTEVLDGEFISDDQIPESLTPVLKRMAKEQISVLLDTAQALDKWHIQHPGEAIPRSIGKHQFSIEGISEQRSLLPYSIWMWQRPVDYYQGLSADDKQVVDPWLEELGLKQALNTTIKSRVKRVNNKLVFDLA